jgi:hypothetical protein
VRVIVKRYNNVRARLVSRHSFQNCRIHFRFYALTCLADMELRHHFICKSSEKTWCLNKIPDSHPVICLDIRLVFLLPHLTSRPARARRHESCGAVPPLTLPAAFLLPQLVFATHLLPSVIYSTWFLPTV